jgi:hopanoid-associated phosphorylase
MGEAALSFSKEDSPAAIIAFVGLTFEARIAAGPGVIVVCRGTEHALKHAVDQAAKMGARRIISFGVAGGLASHLRPGDTIVASSIFDGLTQRSTDRVWSQTILKLIPGALHAPIVGVDTAITDPAAKRRIYLETGAAAVDMESHLVSRLGSAHELKFAAVRVVVDPADRLVPQAALAGMRPDGSTSVTEIMRGLISQPSQLPGLLQVARNAYTARTALSRHRKALGPGFGVSEN